ncbi:MAG: hypothetical protein AAF990_14285 [Bacteroidota bacterium]
MPAHSNRSSIDANLVNAQFNALPTDWAIYPNPPVNFFQLEAELELPTEVEVRLMSITASNYKSTDMGNWMLDFNLEAALPTGQYILQIATGTE